MRDPKERLRDIIEAIGGYRAVPAPRSGSIRARRTPAGVVRLPLADYRRGGPSTARGRARHGARGGVAQDYRDAECTRSRILRDRRRHRLGRRQPGRPGTQVSYRAVVETTRGVGVWRMNGFYLAIRGFRLINDHLI